MLPSFQAVLPARIQCETLVLHSCCREVLTSVEVSGGEFGKRLVEAEGLAESALGNSGLDQEVVHRATQHAVIQ